jgi:DNA-binding XRE family transcriptional regulator/ribosomal protein S27E
VSVINELMVDTLIAAKLKEWRKVRRFSQLDLALRAGVSRTLVSVLERGQGNMTVKTIYRLAAALGCDIDELLPPISEVRKRTGADMNSQVVGAACSNCGKWGAVYYKSALCRDCLIAEGLPVPCPDCGHVPLYGTITNEFTQGFVQCPQCGRSDFGTTTTGAIIAWNEAAAAYARNGGGG